MNSSIASNLTETWWTAWYLSSTPRIGTWWFLFVLPYSIAMTTQEKQSCLSIFQWDCTKLLQSFYKELLRSNLKSQMLTYFWENLRNNTNRSSVLLNHDLLMEEELETSTTYMLVPKTIREEPVSNGRWNKWTVQSISISETMANKMARWHFMLRIKHKVQSRISTCMQRKKAIRISNSSPSFL